MITLFGSLVGADVDLTSVSTRVEIWCHRRQQTEATDMTRREVSYSDLYTWTSSTLTEENARNSTRR